MSLWQREQREQWLRMESGLNPELVRDCVREIKSMAKHKEPEYVLPADSLIEFHVREILLKAKAYFEEVNEELQVMKDEAKETGYVEGLNKALEAQISKMNVKQTDILVFKGLRRNDVEKMRPTLVKFGVRKVMFLPEAAGVEKLSESDLKRLGLERVKT